MPSTVADSVRAEMARARRNQTDIAALLSISQAQVSQRLKGAVDFRVTEISAIAEYLGVPVTTFFPEPVAA